MESKIRYSNINNLGKICGIRKVETDGRNEVWQPFSTMLHISISPSLIDILVVNKSRLLEKYIYSDYISCDEGESEEEQSPYMRVVYENMGIQLPRELLEIETEDLIEVNNYIISSLLTLWLGFLKPKHRSKLWCPWENEFEILSSKDWACLSGSIAERDIIRKEYILWKPDRTVPQAAKGRSFYQGASAVKDDSP